MLESLPELISQCAIVDRHRLKNELHRIQRLSVGKTQGEQNLARLNEKIKRSSEQCMLRWNTVPREIHIPPELPIATKAEEIVDLLGKHQVIVVAGETGS